MRLDGSTARVSTVSKDATPATADAETEAYLVEAFKLADSLIAAFDAAKQPAEPTRKARAARASIAGALMRAALSGAEPVQKQANEITTGDAFLDGRPTRSRIMRGS